jgi:hypothetical protein
MCVCSRDKSRVCLSVCACSKYMLYGTRDTVNGRLTNSINRERAKNYAGDRNKSVENFERRKNTQNEITFGCGTRDKT